MMEQVDRNAKIYEDRMKGMSTVELVKKYNISQTRISQIVRRERDSRKFKGLR